MAIDIETFENTPEEELTELSNPERVLQFLVANRDHAFKAVEIAERTGVNKNSISTVLGRLEDRGLVRHNGEYWALGDEERLRPSTTTATPRPVSTSATGRRTRTHGALLRRTKPIQPPKALNGDPTETVPPRDSRIE